MKRLVVIGGGPAGTAAAITARQLGTAVLLIEAAAFPRFRPGESLHPGIEPALAALDAERCLRNAPYLRYPGTWVSWGGTQGQFATFGADHRGTWLGYQVPRAQLDVALLSLAERAGADVWRECKAHAALRHGNSIVGVMTDQGSVEADAIIDASGTTAWLARQLGVPLMACSTRLVAQYGYAEGACPSTKLPRILADEHGWTWLAQVAEYRYHWTRVTQPESRAPRSWRPDIYKELNVSRTGGADVTWRKARQVAGPVLLFWLLVV
jgi:2-polyprenyl-6-methoxyphenol hydroxylase-like FAD-dependent oxidoreductase